MWKVNFRTGRHRQELDAKQVLVKKGSFVSSPLGSRTKRLEWGKGTKVNWRAK